MKKHILVIGIIAVVIAILLIAGPKRDKGQINEVTVGFVSALSGDAASWGEGALRGAQIAVEEFQAKRKLKGTSIKLEIADDKCDAKEGVTALQQLLIKSPIVITGTVCSSPTIAMLPITEQRKIVFVSAGASSPKLSDMGDYFFRVYPSDSYSASITGEYAVKHKGLKTFATLTINNEYGDGFKRSFGNSVQKAGGNIVSEELFSPNASDFRTELTKIKQKNPDAIFIASNPQEFPLIIKQINEFGIESILLGDMAYVESDEGKTAWKDINELYYAVQKESSSDTWKRVSVTYKARYNKEADFLVQIGYDSVKVVLDTMDETGIDSEKIKDYLYNLKDYEAAGGILTFDRRGDVQKPYQVKEIKNGETKVIE